LLGSCGYLLDTTDRIFTAALSDESRTKDSYAIRGLVSKLPRESFNIKNMIKGFLGDLYGIMLDKTTSPRPECVLEAFYGTVILFTVRRTLRSILRFSRNRFTSFGHQANQDHSFERGVACTLYQPMLAVLESSKMTFSEMLESMGPDSNRKTALFRAACMIHIPDPMNATPLEHILFFFEKLYPARVASIEKSVESAAKKPSEHLAAADPWTIFLAS